MSGFSDLSAAYAACESLVRERDRDRWLACLFVPASVRANVLALYAFNAEIARVPEIVSQPTLGEIRLQWWVEVIEGARRGEGAGHPVAMALIDTMERFHLPPAALTGLIEARRFDLYNDPMPSLNDLEGFLGESVSALFRLASIVIANGEDPGGAEAAGHAGVAYGLVEILGAMGEHAAHGQCFIPRDVLARHGALPEAVAGGLASSALEGALAEMRARARHHEAVATSNLGLLNPAVRVALLSLALVPARLKRLEQAGRDPFAGGEYLPQWRAQWILWRAARRL
jgi:phytoene synthase